MIRLTIKEYLYLTIFTVVFYTGLTYVLNWLFPSIFTSNVFNATVLSLTIIANLVIVIRIVTKRCLAKIEELSSNQN